MRSGYTIAAAVVVCLVPSHCPPSPRTRAGAVLPGEREALVVSRQMPYARVTVDAREGYFVLDFRCGRQRHHAPRVSRIPPNPRQSRQPRSLSGFPVLRQLGPGPPAAPASRPGQWQRGAGGVIGTVSCRDIYTVDHRGAALYRAQPAGFCSDTALQVRGIRAAVHPRLLFQPTRDAEPHAPAAPGAPNIPSLPIRLGGSRRSRSSIPVSTTAPSRIR